MSKVENLTITLTPHRSLTREGFIVLMAVFGFANLAAGLMFLVAGAWPVFGFMGLDVLILWWAFRQNFSDAKKAERITLLDDRVTLSRIASDGATQDIEFNRRWLRVDLEYDEERELFGRLLLTSHGVSHEIASFLGADERRSLAHELRRVI
jgi:uncharacterized membrane protein